MKMMNLEPLFWLIARVLHSVKEDEGGDGGDGGRNRRGCTDHG